MHLVRRFLRTTSSFVRQGLQVASKLYNRLQESIGRLMPLLRLLAWLMQTADALASFKSASSSSMALWPLGVQQGPPLVPTLLHPFAAAPTIYMANHISPASCLINPDSSDCPTGGLHLIFSFSYITGCLIDRPPPLQTLPTPYIRSSIHGKWSTKSQQHCYMPFPGCSPPTGRLSLMRF